MGGQVIYTVQGRLQVMPCGVTGGAYESRSLMKGRPSVSCVGPDKLERVVANLEKYYVADIGIATDDERLLATWATRAHQHSGF